MLTLQNITDLGIERFSVVVGISSLGFLSTDYLQETPQVKVALPDNLIRLIEIAREGSEEHQIFLRDLVSEFREGEAELSPGQLAERLHDACSLLRETGSLIEITEEDIDGEIAYELDDGFNEERYFISLSPRDNFVKNFYLRALSWAKKTGSLLVETTQNLYKIVGHYITAIQLPDKLDQIFDSKHKHIDRLFSFKGGSSTKWFLGAVSGTASFIHPLLGIPGLLITYIDP